MKKTIYLILLFIAFSSYVKGQQRIVGIVVNNDKSPIPFTSIYNLKDSTGTYTSNDGFFHLPISSLPIDIEIRNVGYVSKRLKIHSSDSITIRLEQRIIKLEEVLIIENNSLRKYDVGSPKKPKGKVGYKAEALHQQLALIVKNKNGALYTNSYLDRFSVKIVPTTLGGIKPDGEKHLRLRIYHISDIGKVGEDILNENIFLSPEKAGWYDVKLERKIPIPEDGFVIAVEWIKNQKIKKWKKSKPSYGLLIDGHKLKKEKTDFYSALIFNPELQKWGFYNNQNNIPCFKITLAEIE